MAKRILLVDDEPLILKGLRFTLEQEGYEILTAADGEEALQVFFALAADDNGAFVCRCHLADAGCLRKQFSESASESAGVQSGV